MGNRIKKIFSGTLLGLILLSVLTIQVSTIMLVPGSMGGSGSTLTAAVGDPIPAGTSKKTGEGGTVGIENPLKFDSIQCLAVMLLQIAVNIGAFASVLYLLYAGFLFVSAQGESGKVTAAKNTLYNALIGTALIMGAWVFAQIIARTVGTITGQNVSLVNQNECK
jgi:hypothetical protein